jgi:hypothetical protein
MPDIKFQTDQMNMAIQSLINLDKHLVGVDINAFLLQTFVLSGVVPTEDSIPGKMMKSLIQANQPQEKPTTEGKQEIND